jgi:hypothetical protein
MAITAHCTTRDIQTPMLPRFFGSTLRAPDIPYEVSDFFNALIQSWIRLILTDMAEITFRHVSDTLIARVLTRLDQVSTNCMRGRMVLPLRHVLVSVKILILL